MSNYIEFVKIEDRPKTSVFAVISISSGETLGTIKWHGPWRQYCFFPDAETLWNKDCLAYVFGFLQGLMDARKKEQ